MNEKTKCLAEHKFDFDLRCPCELKTQLLYHNGYYTCNQEKCCHSTCEMAFRTFNNKPVIISEAVCDTVCSVKKTESYVRRSSKFKKVTTAILLGENSKTKENCKEFVKKLETKILNPKVLVIGSGERGSGTEALWCAKDLTIIGIDIYESESVDIICDAHHLPFKDNSFDGVWIQAVLEHVVEPQKVVDEIFRVINYGGFVYAETPFMQQVHEGAYDFTRFTVLGHRYLFKNFKLVKLGGLDGPEVVFAWSAKYLLWSIFRSLTIAKVIGVLLNFLLRPLRLVTAKTALYDSASGVFFMGEKVEDNRLSHKDLVNLYKGGFN